VSFRRRLVVTFVGLVALTALLIGLGAYAFASLTLNQRLYDESRQQAAFNIGTLSIELLSDTPTREEIEESRLAEAFFIRGGAETLIDFGEGDPYVSRFALSNALPVLSPELHRIVEEGGLGYQRLTIDGQPYLVMAGRRPSAGPGLPDGPDFYFFFDARPVDDALSQLATALLAGGVLAVLLAALVGGLLARGVMRPVGAASEAAQRIAAGDLSARLPTGGSDEFGRWAASFNRMAASLEEKVAQLQEAQSRQRRFVSDVSHELRTPLTALVNEAAMLRTHLDALPPEGRRVGELLTGDVARLRSLVADLMEISRFDASAEEIQPADLDLEAFLRAVASARAPEAELRLAGGPLFVRTDPRRLERIVANLLDNARQHAGGDGLELAARMSGGEAVISVADRGPGVPAEQLPHLFERFYKADPSRHAGGSGLGLAIARENAELLGGSLRARAREGGGMIFELRLPVTPSLPERDGRVTAEPESGTDRRVTRPVTEAQP
jgi:signal transduction histidine kinase